MGEQSALLHATPRGPTPMHPPPFIPITPTGLWMTFGDSPGGGEKFGHVALGPHDVRGADCENCDTPMHRLLSLDVRDPRLSLPALAFD